MQIAIEVKGVTVVCEVWASKYDGYDTLTRQRFTAGAQIAYCAANRLTPEQKQAFFPNGRVYAVTIMYPVTYKGAVVKEVTGKSDLYAKSVAVAPVVSQKRSARPYTPSSYQAAILESLLKTESHILIDAKAGSGKTETLIWLIDNLYDLGLLDIYSVVFLAFNTHIRDELNVKLTGTGVPAYTSHAFGYMLLKKRFGQGVQIKKGSWLTRGRFQHLICRMNGLSTTNEGLKEARKMGEYKSAGAVCELVEKSKNWAVFPEWVGDRWAFSLAQRGQMKWFVEKYEIEHPKEVEVDTLVDWACDVLAQSIPVPGSGLTEIEFDDMLYLPLMLELPVPYYDVVLTDETQDFNRAQALMLERLCKAVKGVA